MQGITFEVLRIEKAAKEGYVRVTVRFNGESKEYGYIRKSYNVTRGIGKFVIDGVEVRYSKADYSVLSYKRLGDTTGSRRKSFAGTAKKIAEEIEQKDLTVELQVEEQEEEKEEVVYEEPEVVRHDKFNQIKICIENKIPVFLAGPAGAGKNHTLEQVADELDYEFYFTNSVQQEYQLTGFVDAGGNYHDTQFYRACKRADEGIDTMFFLDEMDASIPEVLVKLNMAIAQGYFEFPNGEVLSFKENIHWVAAGNTVGSGADEMYTGRMVLDGASLDRFAIIDFDYCLAIEMKLSKGNVEFVNFIHELRDKAKQNGVRATFSYRCIMMVQKLESAHMSLGEILKIAVFKGMDKDTLNTMTVYGETKYHKALQEIQRAA